MRLKPLTEQVAVITGASSGIGRASAKRMAAEGAVVVALARDEGALRTLVEEIRASGGNARHLVCDVTDLGQVQAAADRTEEWFGRIDTWVDNAGVLLYGEFEETTPDEFRRVMEVNFMGHVHGALAALPALRRAGGGALISIASGESSLTLPMHSAYAASKAAGEAAMDGLRRELISQGAPISVTTIHPAVIDTPGYPNARNHMDVEPSAPPPYYDPSVVASCVAFAATHPVPKLYAGGSARAMHLLQTLSPRVVDLLIGRLGMRFMRGELGRVGGQGNLYAPLHTGEERGGLPRPGRRLSVYTWLAVHPSARLAIAAAASAALAAAVMRKRMR